MLLLLAILLVLFLIGGVALSPLVFVLALIVVVALPFQPPVRGRFRR